MKALLCICAVCMLLFSCKKDSNKPATISSFSFGTFNGICPGGCPDMYKLSNNFLFKDSISNGFLSPVIYSGVPLPQTRFLIAQPVQDSFPAYLEASPNSTFGNPDSYDQGRIFIERINNGVKETWSIDTDENAAPAAIKNYVLQIKTVLAQL